MGIVHMLGNRWDVRLQDREVIKLIARLDRPCSYEEIAAMLGCHRSTVRRSIRRLTGIIKPIGSGNRVPYTYEIDYSKLPESLRFELNQSGGAHD